ncbi:MAG: ABC transporter permease [Jiangellaceae bacterium]|nr:ABC transporter permease [Jiangellaceae bacterium]
MRFQYVFSEVVTGLRRNLTMTLAVVITVAISMGFLGTGLLLRAQAETMKDYWYDKIEISVFMCNAFDKGAGCAGGQVTDEQKAKIEQTLTSHPEVQSVFYESQDEAYQHFREQFQNSIADTITPDQLQEAYRVQLGNPEEFEGVVSAVAGLPGVHQVVDQRELLEPFFDVINGLQWAAAAVTAIMVVAAVLLIANTIRLAAFSRRRETGIMRLVGASNFYIQLPFILEAAIAGVTGAVLAAAGVVLVKALFIDGRLAKVLEFVAWVDWNDTLEIVPWLMVSGVLLTAVAAFLTLRRYLRV